MVDWVVIGTLKNGGIKFVGGVMPNLDGGSKIRTIFYQLLHNQTGYKT